MTTPTCDKDNYQYYVYGVLGIIIFASETLGITKRVQSNSIVQILMGMVKSVMPKTQVAPEQQTQDTAATTKKTDAV